MVKSDTDKPTAPTYPNAVERFGDGATRTSRRPPDRLTVVLVSFDDGGENPIRAVSAAGPCRDAAPPYNLSHLPTTVFRTGRCFAADANAMATARSAAGSTMDMPPTLAT